MAMSNFPLELIYNRFLNYQIFCSCFESLLE